MKTEAALSVPVLEVLDTGNYVDWSVRLKTYLMAQDLWDIVEGTTKPPQLDEDEAAFKVIEKENMAGMRENGPENIDFIPFFTLREAVRNGEWKGVKDFLEKHPDAMTAKIEIFGRTPLQVAIAAGHMHMVEKLVERMSQEELKTVDDEGFIALAEATCGGNYQMAKCILKKNKSLVRIANMGGVLPVVLAIVTGHIELARYLYSLTPIEDLKPENGISGAELCTQAIHMGALDIALDMIRHVPSLALAIDNREMQSPLYALASTSYAFPSRNPIVFWKQWIYSCHIQSARTSSPYETCLSIPNQVRNPELDHQVKRFGHTGIKQLYEMKAVHAQSRDLLQLLCCEVTSTSDHQQRHQPCLNVSIYRAIYEGNVEFFLDMVRTNPELVWILEKTKGRNILSHAIGSRQATVFNIICGLHEKNQLAGMLPVFTVLSIIPGAALKMQRELQRFKVESIVQPKIKEHMISQFYKPWQYFVEEHKNMMEDGERWIKDTTTSCTVVDSLSLFSSSTSVLIFLEILTSCYVEDDFLKSLLTKMIISLSTLLFSITTMMIAFSTAILIILQKSWIVIPVICLASVPVTLFVLMQFPLLVEMSCNKIYHSGGMVVGTTTVRFNYKSQ
ncbi:hypothetical protein I3760_13G103700 [Carya illinoinensis]|nr:hypothetical protein I3760_13G103700 [Carya illinoinensis]